MSGSVAGRTALITGAAQGIGLGTARALHGRGGSVVLADLDATASRAAAASLGAERTLGLAADVTSRAALDAAVAASVKRFGGLDIVVANAGVAPPTQTVRALADADFERVIAVNLTGVWNSVRAALPHVIERRGEIVVVSSIYAFANDMLKAPYAMAKAGVEQLGRALRRELGVHGVSVSVAYFGFIDTAMVRSDMEDPLSERMLGFLPRPLHKTLSPDAAGEAIARGIERGSPRIIAPRRWALLQLVRGLTDPLEDRHVMRNREISELLREGDTPRAERPGARARAA